MFGRSRFPTAKFYNIHHWHKAESERQSETFFKRE